ncbi:MFS transporter [Nakamurella alba]|uniref:MFS transporter n=1 Tax=Nakamurella alba TaxID=2665158 RepID=UPI002AC37273|nr:MFS transporter [Nakamurella alba]
MRLTGPGGATAPPAALPGDFLRLLLAWFSSLTGDGLRMVALPLLAAWVSPTPGAVAAVAAFTSLPWLLVAVPAGALVDRMSAVVAIRVAHVVRALCTLGLVVAVETGWYGIPVLCAFGFVLTAAETFADGAAQTMIVRIVPQAQLEKANTRFAVVETVALDLVGPLVAGVTFVVAGWIPFALSAAAFAVAAVVVGRIRAGRTTAEDRVLSSLQRAAALPTAVPTAPPTDPPTNLPTDLPVGLPTGPRHRRAAPVRGPLTGEIREGLRRLFADPVLRTLVITVAVLAAAVAAQDGVLVLYATEDLGLSPELYPTLLVAMSVGILVTAPFVGRWADRFGQGPLMVTAIVATGSGIVLMGLLPHPVTGWACYLLIGASGVTWNVLSATRRQRRTPVEMAARVSSAFRVVAFGAAPVGNVLGGVIGHLWGVQAVFLVAGGAMLVTAACAGRSFFRPLPPSDSVHG